MFECVDRDQESLPGSSANTFHHVECILIAVILPRILLEALYNQFSPLTKLFTLLLIFGTKKSISLEGKHLYKGQNLRSQIVQSSTVRHY